MDELILAAAGLVISFLVLLFIRNEYVYHYRTKILFNRNFTVEENLNRFRRLPTYEAMLFNIFRWNWCEYMYCPNCDGSVRPKNDMCPWCKNKELQ